MLNRILLSKFTSAIRHRVYASNSIQMKRGHSRVLLSHVTFKKLHITSFQPRWVSFPGFSGFLHEQTVWLRCLLGRGPGSDSTGERAASSYPAWESKGDFLAPFWFQSGMLLSRYQLHLPCLRFLWNSHFMIVLIRHQILRLQFIHPWNRFITFQGAISWDADPSLICG